ncbi:DEAD/DEAH box helicase [Brevibacterium aurantiacum]|uniref:DEAD/DEAH box helicase n=1 Tax=Brevibacterium aurantiacum TaxID=273384 RepID=A0A2H1L0U6_BREAU|nr:DEAD/DEAH box helicase [Brevibacterium aurantiacum]SMY05454.1 DEAD/DEAH box helicase [Brevibacterium aurantiacum]
MMTRLLHGDVGSGKTLVALRAMLTAVDSGAQAAMLAPTEVLAAQHFHSIQSLLDEQMALSPLLSDDDQVTVALMTGSMPAKDRRELALDLVTGNIDIVVGTHALLSASTMFADLGLIVVDEQHRFPGHCLLDLRGNNERFVEVLDAEGTVDIRWARFAARDRTVTGRRLLGIDTTTSGRVFQSH